jgi:hypothetical protein
MEQHWLIVERPENWKADQKNGFSFFGLPPRYRQVASEIKKGDKVYCYVSTGVSSFSDIRVVVDEGVKETKEDSFHDIYDRTFAYYFTTSPVLILPRKDWVPLKQLISMLELTKSRTPASCRAVFQTSIRKLSPEDAALITSAMNPTVKPRAG